MQQEVLFATSLDLFEVGEGGKTIEKGNCAAAVVALPGAPTRYTLLCYRSNQAPLCACPITAANTQGLRLTVQSGDFLSFYDNRGRKFNAVVRKVAQIDRFLAAIAAAAFGAAGAGATASATVVDVTPPRGELRLGLDHRAKVHFAAFGVRGGSGGSACALDDLMESSADRPYTFTPVPSAAKLLPESKGFEAFVAGMQEDGVRLVVVPTGMPRGGGRSAYPTHNAVAFVVRLQRILFEDTAALVPIAPDIPQPPIVDPSVAVPLADDDVAEGTGGRGGFGAGIPAEQMAIVQRTAADVNAAVVATRDLHDHIVGLHEEWKQSVNPPQPSLLTPSQVENQIRLLMSEHERVSEDLQKRDELIRALDNRNRELQKRVDTAAVVAQQLMDEKQKSVGEFGDLRLEKDRAIMQLQQRIAQCSSERDDVHRHLQTVKRLLEASDSELRDIRGRIEVHAVTANSLRGKLAAAEEALEEERSRRKALAAKASALQESIRNAEADLHLSRSQLEDLRRRCDAERAHDTQVMEDERQRRNYEAQQLRSEIVEELQQREAKFAADRARTSEENYRRGHDEGKGIGRSNARIDVDARMQELQVEAQRASGTLEAMKAELREATTEALTERRKLDAVVTQLRRDLESATSQKVQDEQTILILQSTVQRAGDQLFLAFANVAHRVTHPVPAAGLLEALRAAREGRPPSLGFVAEERRGDERRHRAVREGWMVDAAIDAYRRTVAAAADDAAAAIDAAHAACVANVATLWVQRDARARRNVEEEESDVRRRCETEWGDGWIAIEGWAAEQREERELILRKALGALNGIFEEADIAFDAIMGEAMECMGSLMRFLARLRDERQLIESAADEGRSSIEAEEEGIFSAFVALVVLQREEREAAIASACSFFAAIVKEEDNEWTSLTQGMERILCAEIISRQEAFFAVELQSREVILNEETTSLVTVLDEQHCIELLISEQQQRTSVDGDESITRLTLHQQESAAHAQALMGPPEPVFDPLSSSAPPVATLTVPEVRRSVQPKSPRYGSDSDSDVLAPSRLKAPPPKPNQPAKAPVKATALFGDSDSDEGASSPPQKSAAPPPKRVAAKPAITANSLFASDSD